MKNVWSEEDLNLFIELYPTEPMEKLIERFKRSKGSLASKASELGLKRNIKSDGSRYFSEEEKEYIKKNSLHKTYKEIAKDLGRTQACIHGMANLLNVKSGFWWTEEDKQFLIDNFPTGNKIFICETLNKSWKAIGKKAREMGLNRIKSNGEKFTAVKFATDEEDRFILQNYVNMTSIEMGRKLKRSAIFVEGRCRILEIEPFRQRKILMDFSDDDLLQSLKILEEELGRTPSIDDVQKDRRLPSVDTYYDRFGSYTNALVLANVDIFSDSSMGKRCFSKNGDLCYSIPEKDITDFFIDNNISYTKEVLYSEFIPFFDRKYRADWVLQDGLVVEYFGLERDQGYADKSENKMEICKNNNVSLLDLYKKDLSNLLFIFEEYIH